MERVDKAAIQSLPAEKRYAFCAACLEHVRPLYEEVVGREDLREAVGYLWNLSGGARPDQRQLSTLSDAVAAAIPDSEEDGGDLVGSMHRAVAVGVLEALDTASGNRESAARVGFAALDAIDVADLLFRRRPMGNAGPPADPPEIAEELAAQADLLRELDHQTSLPWLQWRDQHSRRGRQLLVAFAPPRP